MDPSCQPISLAVALIGARRVRVLRVVRDISLIDMRGALGNIWTGEMRVVLVQASCLPWLPSAVLCCAVLCCVLLCTPVLFSHLDIILDQISVMKCRTQANRGLWCVGARRRRGSVAVNNYY